MRVKGMGKAIRRYREEAGITQERLAELEYWKRNPITYRLSTGGRFFAV